jgi:hypothetical protein
MINIGLEKIGFQGHSSLAKELVYFFTEQIRIAKDLKEENEDIEKTINAFGKQFEKQEDTLIDIIYKNTKLKIKKVKGLYKEGPSNVFSIAMTDKTEKGLLFDGIGSSSGQMSYKKSKFKDVLEMLSNEEHVDLKTGTLTISPNNPFYNNEYVLTIDLVTAFFGKDVLIGVKNYTTEELTTIILHEIGHPITILEHSTDVIYKTELLRNFLVNLEKEDIVDEVVKNKKTILSLVSGLRHIKTISNKTTVTLQNFIINFIKSVETTKSRKIIGLPLRIVTKLISIAFRLFILIVFLLLAASLFVSFKIVTTLYDITILKDGYKKNDETNSRRNNYYIERLADEYVSMHGMGPYLADALLKLNGYSEILTPQSLLGYKYASHANFVSKIYLVSLKYLFKALGIRADNFTIVYEDVVSRIERLLQNNMSIFKDRNLSPTVRDDQIKKTEELLYTIKQLKGGIGKSMLDTLSKMIGIFTPTNIYSILSTGNLPYDYEKLFKEAENLINNKAYYQAAKIQSFL